MTAPQGAHDCQQGLLPEPRVHSRFRASALAAFSKMKQPKSASNHNQPGYSGLNRDTTINLFFCAVGRHPQVENHSKTRVNTLKNAYARINSHATK